MGKTKRIWIVVIAVSVLIICSILIPICLGVAEHGSVYETNDVKDFGNYTGNYNNEFPATFISSFFPEKIEDYFSDITYHYKAKKFDTYAFECYLEFVIEDPSQFSEFIARYVDANASQPFMFDDAYNICIVSNDLDLDSIAGNTSKYSISFAKIGNILYSVDEQRIIFVAIGVYDGGGTFTNELNFFFDRFSVDPMRYKNAYC